MPQIRGAAGSTTNSSGVIIGCVLLALLVLGFFQQQMQKRKRRTQYHPPLQLQQSSSGVLEQIAKRKEDLRRYIGKLKEQLAAREDQLRYHDELEEIVTSRVATSRRDDEEWSRLMKAGKELHGDKWTASIDDEPSLNELMELHKEELLEYKRSLHNRPDSSRQGAAIRSSTSRERKGIRRPSKFNLPMLKLQPVAPVPSASHGIGATIKPYKPKAVPPQWQSTRAKAGSRLLAAIPVRLEAPTSESEEPMQKMAVPPLDFSKLSGGPAIAISREVPEEPAQKQKKKTFEATYQRQTRLAALLRKKK